MPTGEPPRGGCKGAWAQITAPSYRGRDPYRPLRGEPWENEEEVSILTWAVCFSLGR